MVPFKGVPFFSLVALVALLNPSRVEGWLGFSRESGPPSPSRDDVLNMRDGPSPQHGGWSSWGSWSSCYSGYETKRRSCNNPSPSYGGHDCSGSSTDSRDCNECNDNNGGCDHRCINYVGGFLCECFSGYRRDPRNWKKCVLSGRECEALNPPDKGDIIPDICKTKPLHDQWCIYVCSSGYTQYGPRSTKCDNGKWTQPGFHCRDTQPPTFITCPSTQSVIADKGKTTATVTWAPVKATDNDNVPITPQPRPDVKSPHEFPEGTHTVVYTATDQSNNKRFCHFEVKVQVLRCSVFTPPANGRLDSGACGNVYGSACRWQCDKGYKRKGTIVRYCDKIPGTNQVRWTGNTPSCEAVMCPPLKSPDNAVIACSASYPSYNTSCLSSCKRGYEAVTVGTRASTRAFYYQLYASYFSNLFARKSVPQGNLWYPGYEAVRAWSQRTCQENQKWSGVQLQCQAVKCPTETMESEGLIVYPPICAKSSASLVYGTECRFTCKTGYQLRGPGLRTCSHNKTLVPIGNPSCKDISGPTFLNCPSNVIATADRGTTSASVTWTPPKATDNSGIIPNVTHSGKRPGERFSAGEHTIRYLATDRTGNIGECKFKILVSVVRCLPRLYAPTRGATSCTKDNMYGSECSFTCKTGYTVVGPAKRVCEKTLTSSTGFWTGKEVKCELVRCPRLITPPHSMQSGCGAHAMYNVFGDKCLFYCNIGYRQIKGSTERVCQADGTWSGNAPYCQVVRCSSLQAPNDGNVSPSSCTTSPEYGTTCGFSCQKGYRLQGEQTASCLRDGQWSKNTSVSCEALRCPTLRPPLNGPFLVGDCDNMYGTTCRMKCQEGYNLFGASNLTCEATPGHVEGYWDNPIPVCKVACPVGTFHRQQSSTCTPCPQGTYQDEEGKRTCKPCGEGETTRGQGSGARKDCFLERGNL